MFISKIGMAISDVFTTEYWSDIFVQHIRLVTYEPPFIKEFHVINVNPHFP